MDLSGFDAPGFSGDLNAQARQASAPQVAVATPAGQGNHGGIFHAIASSLLAAPKYFVNADIIDPAKELMAQATGNQTAYNNAFRGAQQNLVGNNKVSSNNGQNATNFLKTLASNTGQLAGTVLAPEAKGAGLLPKVAAAAKGGAIIGGSSALGNNQNILKGAAEGAATGAVAAPVASLISKLGGRVITNGANGLENATEANPTIGQKISNALINKGQQEEAKIGSFAPGQKVNGQQLSVAASQRIGQTLKNEGINGIGTAEQASQVEQKLNSLNQARSSLIDSHNQPLTPQDLQTLRSAIEQRLQNTVGGTADTVQKHANTFINELMNSKDVAALGKYKTGLDNNAINWARNPASVEPGQQLAAKTIRGVLKDYIEQKVPGIADVNARATALQTAHGALLNASNRIANLTSGGEGLWGRLLSGDTAEKGKQVLARATTKAGEMLGGKPANTAPETVLPPMNEAATTATPTTGAVPGAGGTPPPPPPPQAQAPTPPTALEGEVVNPGGKAAAGNTPPPPPPVPPTTPQAAPTAPATPATPANVAAGKYQIPQPVVRAGTTTAGLGILGSLSGNQQQQTPTTPQYGTSALNTGTAGTQAAAGQNSQYPEANMLYDIERDPAHASTYEALYKIINPPTPASSLSNLTTQQKNQLAGSQNAIAALQGYLQQIQGLAGSMTGPLAGTLGTTLGKYGLGGSEAANAYALQQSAADVATQIAGGLSPTGRAAQGLINQVKESLPKVTDSPAVAQDKATQLVARLQAVMQTEATPLSTYVGNSAGGGDLASQLSDLLASQGSTGGQ